MWARLESQGGQNAWHNPSEPRAERLHKDHDSQSSSSDDVDRSGTWGERDAGIPNEVMAMEDYRALRRELTNRSRTSAHQSLGRRQSSRRQSTTTDAADEESQIGNTEAQPKDEDDFELSDFMREGHLGQRKGDKSAKKVGVVYKNLTVKGVAAGATFVRTLPDAIMGTFGPDLYHILSRFIPFLRAKNGELKTLINDFSGVVRDGEMMLVLGRPGSGCTTFLKTIANDRESYAQVDGDVSYGGIPADKQRKMYRGEVNYNMEDDVHFATLNVWQTFMFALLTKTKKKAKGDIPLIADALMKMFGISHTKMTLVGDEYTRGVSGGERKRVSIAETLASKSTVVCWDNSTRGLDASTALDYAKSLRIMTDVSNRTTLVTLYQAGQGIYDLMDKVLVIDQGRCIFTGPAEAAKQYFIDLGFECPERQTTADFLTAITDPVERKFRPGCEASTPKTPVELERAFRESSFYTRNQQDIEVYEQHLQQTNHEDAKEFEEAVQAGKSKTVTKKSPYTVSFIRQVLACTQREFWLLWGDTSTLWTKVFIIISNGLIVGSLFYGQPLNTDGAFSRGGSLFFSILFLGWLQLTELMKAVSGRAVVARQKEYAFYRPSAVSVARVIADFPVILVQVCLFTIIMYFMTNLDVDAGKFWIYFLFVYTNTICITALYRMFASLSPTIDDAVRFSGIALNLLIIYTGYVIPKTQLLNDYIWFGWIYYINPISYSFEAVLTNEFSDRTMACAPDNLVPQGPGIDPAFQGCTLTGAAVNAQSVNGADYLQTQYTYTRAHLWRNFGVVVAYTVLYLLVTIAATELFSFVGGGGGALVFKKSKKAKKQVKQAGASDEEKAGSDESSSDTAIGGSTTGEKEEQDALNSIEKSESIFTWRDVEYTVPYQGGERKLLNKVNGYAKPGLMIALMGASGAGKTTLLNTLSQRQKMGVVQGEMFVDGRPLGKEFQRNTGFCEQMDLHDGTATIREALEFSAILRQDRKIPRAEKIAYVDTVIDLLELNDMQDAIISSLGVEQRKRLTIGVELAAKPSLLLFLDEPTSGLDSQSAYSIIRFLKKLTAAGQAIVCTIHQPSSVLIQQFDMVLALNPGGNTFYFGPIGENGKDVIDYFGARGVKCPPAKNVAEFLLETAIKPKKRSDGSKIDWNEEWRNSKEAQAVIEEIDGLKRMRSQSTHEKHNEDEATEFAAPVWLQTTMLTKRVFTQYWRDPSYLYGKLFVAVIVGIFNGFTFWQLGNSIQDMQNRMFTAFLILTIPPTVVNAVVPKFYQNMALWMARELPSRIYGWFAFCTAMVVAEIPIATVSAVVYWLLWYYPSGLPTDSSTAGYVFFMVLLFFWFQSSWYYVNPSTWWISGVLAKTLDGIPVECTSSETAMFNVPAGQTCQSYAGAFADSAGGYLLNPEATANCEYCPYRLANGYLATLNIQAGDAWRDLGIFCVFVVSNWALVYFFIYTVRIKGWTFGFGPLFGALGKMVGVLKKPFQSKKKE
ncbi:putative ABC transporter [Aureobasidium pullulans]|nr:putative ABC transporter [Aureobasidium pullulans]